jgi:hypothetical protein
MPSLSTIPHDFPKHEDAIEALWSVYTKIVDLLSDYASEELTATQAMHAIIVITGKSDDALRLAVGAAIMESATQTAWRANELADALIQAASRHTKGL